MSLSTKDYKSILDIVDTLYSVPDRHDVFQAVCEKLRVFLGIYSAIFIPADPETGAFLVNGYEIFENSESAMLSYLAHYSVLDPFSLTGRFLTHINDSARNTDLVDEKRLLNSEFACDFLIPQAGVFYILGSAIGSQGDLAGIFAIHRQRHDRDFSDREKEIFNIILPHMARSLRNIDLLRCGVDHASTGFIALGEDGRPYFMNEIARNALGEMPLTSIADSGSAASPAYFRSKSGMFRVRTVPARLGKKGKFILLERHPSDKKILQVLEGYKLGHRESEVAVLAVQGLSNREIADILFICEQTVKDYLHDVFGKLKVKRRSELAAKVLGLDIH